MVHFIGLLQVSEPVYIFGFAPYIALAFCVITLAYYPMPALPFLAKICQKLEIVLCYCLNNDDVILRSA
jgi:hypothetical protein